MTAGRDLRDLLRQAQAVPGGGTAVTVTPIEESGAAGKFSLGFGFRF